MASATIVGSIVASASSASGTAHTINLPTGRVVGELLTIMVTLDGNPTSSITGWSATGGVIAGTNVRAVRWLRVCDGSEGDTVEMTTGASAGFAALAYRTTGWSGDTTNGLTQATLTTSSGTPNGPAVTAGWGADDNLFLTFLHWNDGNTVSLSGNPGSHTLHRANTRSTHTGGVGIAMAGAETASASSDPDGTWVLSSSTTVCMRTMAVQKGSEPSGGGTHTRSSGTGRGINRGINRGVA